MCSDMGLTFLCVRKVFRSKPIEVISWKDINYINRETELGLQNAYLVLALGLNRHAVNFLLVSSGYYRSQQGHSPSKTSTAAWYYIPQVVLMGRTRTFSLYHSVQLHRAVSRRSQRQENPGVYGQQALGCDHLGS